MLLSFFKIGDSDESAAGDLLDRSDRIGIFPEVRNRKERLNHWKTEQRNEVVYEK